MKTRNIAWKIGTALSLVAATTFSFLWIKHVVPAQDSANWVTAIATVVALVAAGVAAGAALGQLRLLRLDAEARSQDERVAQARKVFLVSTAPSKQEGIKDPGKLVLYNNSTEPVDPIVLHVRTPDGVYQFVQGIILTPTGREGMPVTDIPEKIADEVRRWQFQKVRDESGNHVGGWGRHPYEVRMIFRDTAGRSWLRSEGHALVEVVGDWGDYLPSERLSLGGLQSQRLITHGN